MSEFSSSSFPANKVLIRGKLDVKGFLAPPGDSGLSSYDIEVDPLLSSPACSLRINPLFTSNGELVCLVPDAADSPLLIKNTNTGEIFREIDCKNVQHVEFSPLGTYLVTWHPRTGPDIPNMKIWDIVSGEVVLNFVQVVYKAGVIQWNGDESFFFKQVSHEVQVFNGKAIGEGAKSRIHCKALTQFKSSSLSPPAVAVFVPEMKGNPGRVSIYTCENVTSVSDTPVASKSLMSASEAEIMWNCKGTSVILHTHADVDTSGASYGGATGLHFLTVTGESTNISRSKEGPIHDVKWSPSDDYFIVAAGTMPSHCTFYDGKGTPIYEFGAAHRNTISWSPHGRFLCLAGFGNLAGEMDFYDTNKKTHMIKMGSNSAHCTIKFGWSPDSRYFITSTLAPRMNVDNGFKIFKYNGVGPVAHYSPGEGPLLFDAVFRPASNGIFPDRPRSPKKQGGDDSGPKIPAYTPPPKAAPYRPPGSSGALASMLAREAAPKGKVKANGGGSVQPNRAPPAVKQRIIPGMTPQMANTKIKPKKEKKEADILQQVAAKKEKDKSHAVAQEKKATVEKVVEPEKKSLDALSPEEKEKKAKGIRKKLKQIDEIKAKSGAGAELNADQKSKLETESALIAELRAMGL